jgi:hypothetical protein
MQSTTGWKNVQPSLPVASALSCMVLLNSTTAFLIGGAQGDEGTSASKTFMLNTAASSQEWVHGPELNFHREGHSCARIRRDSSGHQSRCQFHQHFTSNFFVQKFCAKLFCTHILGFNFFGTIILAQMRS